MGTGCKPVGFAYLGSNPSAPTIFARVAQSVEHFVGNEEVTGSSPVAGSIICSLFLMDSVGIGSPCHWLDSISIQHIDSHGGVAQLVRAHGSYPWRHWFESSHRYHEIRRLPFTCIKRKPFNPHSQRRTKAPTLKEDFNG